jgi:hypothetical protein
VRKVRDRRTTFQVGELTAHVCQIPPQMTKIFGAAIVAP